MNIIILCKSGKPVWVGRDLHAGETDCFDAGLEFDYVLTITKADLTDQVWNLIFTPDRKIV